MPKRKQDPTVGGIAHKELAKTLIRARAERALQDGDDLELQAAALVNQLGYATSGKKQSDAAKASPGRRGQYTVAPDKLLADVEAMHTRTPRLTFSDVCEKVRKRHGYMSAWSVKKAAAAIKWPDPRRRNK